METWSSTVAAAPDHDSREVMILAEIAVAALLGYAEVAEIQRRPGVGVEVGGSPDSVAGTAPA